MSFAERIADRAWWAVALESAVSRSPLGFCILRYWVFCCLQNAVDARMSSPTVATGEWLSMGEPFMESFPVL
jgi:hypothetical protein